MTELVFTVYDATNNDKWRKLVKAARSGQGYNQHLVHTWLRHLPDALQAKPLDRAEGGIECENGDMRFVYSCSSYDKNCVDIRLTQHFPEDPLTHTELEEIGMGFKTALEWHLEATNVYFEIAYSLGRQPNMGPRKKNHLAKCKALCEKNHLAYCKALRELREKEEKATVAYQLEAAQANRATKRAKHE